MGKGEEQEVKMAPYCLKQMLFTPTFIYRKHAKTPLFCNPFKMVPKICIPLSSLFCHCVEDNLCHDALDMVLRFGWALMLQNRILIVTYCSRATISLTSSTSSMSLITIPISFLLSIGTWPKLTNHAGEPVQEFIKTQLIASISHQVCATIWAW